MTMRVSLESPEDAFSVLQMTPEGFVKEIRLGLGQGFNALPRHPPSRRIAGAPHVQESRRPAMLPPHRGSHSLIGAVCEVAAITARGAEEE